MFVSEPFPGYQVKLLKVREEYDGVWYRWANNAGSPGIYRWRYDSGGILHKPTPATSFVGCPRLKPGIVEFQPVRSSLMMQEYKQSVPKCGAIFLEVDVGFADFKYAGPETLIKNYTIHITGLDATIRALDAAKEIVDKAQAEARAVAIKKG